MGYILVTAHTDEDFKKLCGVIGAKDLATKFAKHDDRVKAENQGTVYDAIEAWAKDKTKEDVATLLDKAGINNQPVWNAKEVSEHPHWKLRGAVQWYDDPIYGDLHHQGPAFKMSDTPPRLKWALKPVGADNERVYGRLSGGRSEAREDGRDGGDLRWPSIRAWCSRAPSAPPRISSTRIRSGTSAAIRSARLRHDLCRDVRQGPAHERTDGRLRKADLLPGTPRTRPAPASPAKERSARRRMRGPIPSAESRSTSSRASGESRSAAVRSRKKISLEAGPGSSRTSTRPEEENSRGRDSAQEEGRIDLQVLRALRGGTGPEHPRRTWVLQGRAWPFTVMVPIGGLMMSAEAPDQEENLRAAKLRGGLPPEEFEKRYGRLG